jgi:hypothetical protein
VLALSLHPTSHSQSLFAYDRHHHQRRSGRKCALAYAGSNHLPSWCMGSTPNNCRSSGVHSRPCRSSVCAKDTTCTANNIRELRGRELGWLDGWFERVCHAMTAHTKTDMARRRLRVGETGVSQARAQTRVVCGAHADACTQPSWMRTVPVCFTQYGAQRVVIERRSWPPTLGMAEWRALQQHDHPSDRSNVNNRLDSTDHYSLVSRPDVQL